jgi:hypothetical protein
LGDTIVFGAVFSHHTTDVTLSLNFSHRQMRIRAKYASFEHRRHFAHVAHPLAGACRMKPTGLP